MNIALQETQATLDGLLKTVQPSGCTIDLCLQEPRRIGAHIEISSEDPDGAQKIAEEFCEIARSNGYPASGGYHVTAERLDEKTARISANGVFNPLSKQAAIVGAAFSYVKHRAPDKCDEISKIASTFNTALHTQEEPSHARW